MALTLGKSFDRNFNLRIPFLEGFYNIGVFFNKKSSFLLFRVDPDFSEIKAARHSTKINMFKNLEASKFCETFLKLHNYKNQNLDIQNQFHSIKDEYYLDVNFSINETITLSKINLDNERVLYDTLSLYGFNLSNHVNDFLFLISERQYIDRRMNKKIVRTTGLQISTSTALQTLDEFCIESKNFGKEGIEAPIMKTDEIIKLT